VEAGQRGAAELQDRVEVAQRTAVELQATVARLRGRGPLRRLLDRGG
jgi:hypothetical protein